MKKTFIFVTALLVLLGIGYGANPPDEGEKGVKNMFAKEVQIIQNAALPSVKGSADYFTGTVRVDGLLPAGHESGVSLAQVTFEPGARTAWHMHPKGQTLVITSGLGFVQQEGGSAQEVRPGDVVWFPAGVKHWHGASKAHAMTHFSIVVEQDGKNADWLEQVTDMQYIK